MRGTPAIRHWRQWWLPAVVGLVQLTRLLHLLRQADRDIVRYIPDDAFYYLILARNFATTHRWTFDGVEPASGFHLLWGYLLAALYACAPGLSLHGVIAAAGIVSILCMMATAWLLARTAERIFGNDTHGHSHLGLQLGVLVVMLSALALMVNLYLMETPLALLFCAAALHLLTRTDSRPANSSAALAIGLLGVLSRTEFGLALAVLLALQLVLWKLGRSTTKHLQAAAFGLLGAVAGLAIVTLHTHWISGTWVQQSAQMKLLWAQRMGFNTIMVRSLLQGFFDPSYNSTHLSGRVFRLLSESRLVVLGLLLTGLFLTLLERKPATTTRRLQVAALATIIALYIALYRFDSIGFSSWYMGLFEAPVALLAAGGMHFFWQRTRLLPLAAVAILCSLGIAHSYRAEYFWADEFWGEGIYLAQHPELRPIGAWNAGAIAFASGGPVTNLDGLVNDSILPYEKSGRLTDYIQHRHLRAILDIGGWYTLPPPPSLAAENSALKRCVTMLDVLPADVNADASFPARLFLLKPDCGGTLPTPPDVRP
jgi:hypothetical protein